MQKPLEKEKTDKEEKDFQDAIKRRRAEADKRNKEKTKKENRRLYDLTIKHIEILKKKKAIKIQGR